MFPFFRSWNHLETFAFEIEIEMGLVRKCGKMLDLSFFSNISVGEEGVDSK